MLGIVTVSLTYTVTICIGWRHYLIEKKTPANNAFYLIHIFSINNGCMKSLSLSASSSSCVFPLPDNQ